MIYNHIGDLQISQAASCMQLVKVVVVKVVVVKVIVVYVRPIVDLQISQAARSDPKVKVTLVKVTLVKVMSIGDLQKFPTSCLLYTSDAADE